MWDAHELLPVRLPHRNRRRQFLDGAGVGEVLVEAQGGKVERVRRFRVGLLTGRPGVI